MRSKFTFARTLALALMAIGTVACINSETFAANRTWTNASTNASNNKTKWGTAFVSNWAGLLVPGTGDTAVFNTLATPSFSVAVQPNVSVQGVSFGLVSAGSLGYTFTTNPVRIGTAGIVNNSTKSTTFGSGAILTGNQTWSGSGNGSSLTFNNVNVDGFTLSTATAVIIGTLQNTSATPATVNVQGGDLNVQGGGGPDPIVPVNFNVSSGFLTTQNNGIGYNSSNSDLAVSSTGVYNNTEFGSNPGTTNWDIVTLSGGGAVDLMGTSGVMTANSYAQSGGTIKQYVGYDSSQPGDEVFNSSLQSTDGAGNNTGPITLGGDLSIDMSAIGTNLTPIGTIWRLFQGDNAGGAAASNFSSVFLANDQGSQYNGMSFTQFGTEWFTPVAADGTRLVFQAQTGNLVVVPEPSTMVFAGLGVAMSGWTMWKKRRLSKLLAAKAG